MHSLVSIVIAFSLHLLTLSKFHSVIYLTFARFCLTDYICSIKLVEWPLWEFELCTVDELPSVMSVLEIFWLDVHNLPSRLVWKNIASIQIEL